MPKSIEKSLSRLAAVKGFNDSVLFQVLESFADPARNLKHSIFLKHDMAKDRFTKKEILEKLEKISQCADILEIREYSNGEKKIHNANFCKNPIVCAVCASRVSNRRKAIFNPLIKKAAQKYKYAYFVTFTIPDGSDLSERIDFLAESKKRFRKYGQSRGLKKSAGEYGKITAGISNREIKKGCGSGLYHVHDHDVYFSDDPIDYSIYNQDQLSTLKKKHGENIPDDELNKIVKNLVKYFNSAENKIVDVPVSSLSIQWYRATRGQAVNIDIKPLRYIPKINGKYYSNYSESVAAQCSEILKYNSKIDTGKGINDLTPFEYIEIIQHRGTRRLFNTYGQFRKRLGDMYLSDSERERLEYVEDLEKCTYRIIGMNYNGSGYNERGEYNKALFNDSDKPSRARRLFLGYQASIINEYRKDKNGALKYQEYIPHDDTDCKKRLEIYLDDLRSCFKLQIKELWKSFNALLYEPLIPALVPPF